MRIKTKLFIVLLGVTLVPMAAMRYTGQEAMTELGHDLSRTISLTLLDNAENELRRLVEDHARVLKRERQLVETILRVRVAEIEELLGSPDKVLTPLICPLPREGTPDAWSMAPPDSLQAAQAEELFCEAWPDECAELTPDFSAPGVFPGRSVLPGGESASLPLNRLPPLFTSLAAAYPGLFLWQLITPVDGPTLAYPFATLPGEQPRFGPFILSAEACAQGVPVWSLPAPDPVTGRLVFFVSLAYRDPTTGKPAGVASLVLPVHAVLHENQHVRQLSDDVVSMLVQPDDDPFSVRVVARERTNQQEVVGVGEQPGHGPGMRMGMRRPQWTTAAAPERLKPEDSDEFLYFSRALASGSSSVLTMRHEGRESFWAFSPINRERNISLLLIVPKTDLTRQADAARDDVERRIERQVRLTGIGLTVLFVLVVLTSYVLSRSFTRNIAILSMAARRLAAGDFSVRAAIKGRDEIAELGRTIDQTIPALEERLKLKKAVDLAQEIQHNLLPGAPPKLPGLDLAGTAIYCDETGGDFYDFVRFPEALPVIGVAVGDVSGHGVPAALLMASARAALRAHLTYPGKAGEAVSAVNRLVARDTAATGHFLTLFYLELDTESGVATWIRAGHDPALLYDPANGRFEELNGGGPAIGLDAEASYHPGTRRLESGQVLCIGTDGIWETRGPGGEMYGKDRLRAVLARNGHASAEEVVAAVLDDLAAFRGDQPQEDDVTLAVLVRTAGRS